MISLDGEQTVVETLPNKYIYEIKENLSPTDYQSVLSTKFVVFFSRFFSEIVSFINRYEIENEANGQKSVETFSVYTTGVYTALLYNGNDTKVS
jgi:hypothetical protein